MGAQIDISTYKQQLTTLLVNFTYAALEKRTGVNRYYLWNIVNKPDYQPPAKVCAKLGIVRLMPAPTCSKCGEIHLRRTCPTTAKKRARRAINLADPVSAAATILNHADREYVDRLVVLLNIGE